ncbi:hypothetical protein B0I33_104504 [Prauserella shujinwangii]|uniref:Phage-related protein n=1 Tax=Prauserella shujinwangii TaxID=1453103 RepID=A0A2T0LXD7_9PSEU|nr:hypothetical protein [Prauserella shujinwangii]PRX48686.1 hypothetical protein B0I33_104504 [Prauserella shujinwangii]
MAAGERTIRIRFDGSVRGLARAVKVATAQLQGVEKRVGALRKSTAGFTQGVNSSVRSLVKLAAVLSTLVSGLNIIGGLSAAIGAMSGVLGLLPAAGFAAAGALAAVKLGADGITRAFERLTPTLDTLKTRVSATFERSLAPAVTDLRAVLPRLTGGIQQVAEALGRAASQFTGMLNTGARTEQLRLILDNTAQIIRNLGAFLAPVGAAFIRIGAVGSSVLATMSDNLGAVGERFNAFVQQAADDGRLQAWIENGIAAFQQLGQIVGDIAAVVRAVFQALNDAGIGLGGTLGVITGQMRAFVESARGQEALRALAEALGTVAYAVGTVLNAALQAVAPAIPGLASAFAQLATQVASLLVPAIQLVGPLLAGLAGFLAQNMSWLGPLAIAVAGVAAAIRGVTLAVQLWRAAVVAYTVAQWALNVALSANPIGLIIALIAGLVAAFVVLWNKSAAFRGFFIGVWNAIKAAVAAVVSWFRSAWNAVWNWLTGLWRGAGRFFGSVFNGVRSVVGGVITWFRNAWNGAVNAVRGFFSGLAGFASGVWDGIVSGLKGALNIAIGILNGLINAANYIPGVNISPIPQLARGGTARAGMTYLVGERGPELFTPGRTGRVTNANTTAEALGGGAQTLQLTLDLGEGIQQAFEIKLDRRDRAMVRAVRAGTGGAR